MQIDSLHLPIDWQKVDIHRQANRIGKRRIDAQKLPQDLPNYGRVCYQCGRMQTHCPNFKWCQSESQYKQRYGVYGPNCVIYLGLIKRIIIFFALCSVAYCVPMLILNLLGVVCRESTNACTAQDIIYFWSTYNVLGESPGSLPHHIIWFVFSLSMCVFALYLRKYTLQTYRTINNRNTTDSDFCLILRRLPLNTQQQDVKQLLERQTLLQYDKKKEKNNKIMQEMRHIKVRNVMFIYNFSNLMQVNNKNVDEFKKFQKNKQKGKINKDEQFKPQKLPWVTDFANAAIVRFFNNRDKDLILQTVKTSCTTKVINHFFPFYSSKSQYKIRQQYISIDKAPQPTDIQWQNFGYSQTFRVFRKLISTLFTTTLLIFSAAISISISIWIQSLLSTTGIQPTYLTIILVIITLVINIIIQMIITFAIQQIKLDTFTDQNCEQLSVTVINESINLGFFSIFAPIIAKLPSFIQLNTSSSSSFPLVMFTTIIIQSFLGTTIGFFVEYAAVVQRVMQMLVRKKVIVKTQTQAYNTFKSSQVPFVAAYAHLIKIVWFGFLYGIVSPICVAIGLIGLILYYFYQRSLFNSKYSIPIYGGSRLNSTMIDLLDFTPFLVGLFNLFLYQTSQSSRQFQVDGRVTGIVITNIVVGAFHAVFPWKTVISKFYNQKQCTSIDQFEDLTFDKTYEKCYPAAKPEIMALLKPKVSQKQQQNPDSKVNIKQYIADALQDQQVQTNWWCCR